MSSTRPSFASRYSAASSGAAPGAPCMWRSSSAARGVVLLGERAVEQPALEVGREEAAGAEQARDGIGRLERLEQPARAPGPAAADARAERAGGAGHAAPGLRERRDAVLAVAAEELVRALAGERHRDVPARELAEREEADRREVGERLVEVPDQAAQVVRRRSAVSISSSWCSAPSAVGDPPGVRQLGVAAGEADREGLDRARSMWRAISATIRLESSPPLSIAPSGTSLISRMRTDSSSLCEHDLGPLLGGADRVVGAPAPGSVHQRSARAVPSPTTSRSPGSSLRTCFSGVSGAGHEAERQVGGDRLGVERVVDQPAGDDALQLRAEDDDVVDDRVVERLDAEAVADQHAAARGASQTATANMPRRCSASPGPWSS